MEDLQPDDIVGYHFKQSLRGYAIDEVDQLLDRLADQIERMQAVIDDLRGQVQVAETQAAVTRETEATLQRTLVVAQQAAERNLADASAQAEATLATATADAERIRREAEEEASRVRAEAEDGSSQVRSEAEDEAARILEDAQQFARREVVAARERVEQAAARHADVLASVAHHRDALRRELANLEELTFDAPPVPRAELVAGELPEHHVGPDRASPDGGPEGEGDPADEDPPATPQDVETAVAEPPAPLTIRVHDEQRGAPPSESAPLGSDARDDS